MIENVKTYFTSYVLLVALFGGVLFIQSNSFIDINLIPRFTWVNLVLLILIWRTKIERIHWFEVALFVFYLWNILSLFWAHSYSHVVFESQRVLTYLLVFVVFYRAVKLFDIRVFTLLIYSMVTVCIFTNAIWYLYDSGFYTTSAHQNLLSSLFFIFLMLIFVLEGHNKRFTYWKYTLLTLLSISIFFLGTRSVLLSLVGFLFWFLVQKKVQLYQKLLAIWLFTTTVAAAISYLLINSNQNMVSSVSLAERWFIWEKSILTWLEYPLFGVGSGNWILFYSKHGIGGFDTFDIYGLSIQRPHNEVIWILSELGLVGAGIALLLFVLLIRVFGKFQSKSSRIILAFLLSYTPIALLSFTKERMEHLVFIFLVIALGFGLNEKSFRNFNLPFAKPILLILTSFSLLLGATYINGEYFLKKALRDIEQKDPVHAIENVNKAQSSLYAYSPAGLPLSSFKAWAYHQIQDKEKRYFFTETAANEAPYNYEILSNYGTTLMEQGNYSLAEKILLKAHAINPRYDGAIMNLAILYYNASEYKEALKWIDKVHFKSELTDEYVAKIYWKFQESNPSLVQ